jgi:hypothetical protein
MTTINYLPTTPKAWSRVQNSITFPLPDTGYTQIYVPLINQTVSLEEANYYNKLLYKGNILQYKGNSFQISKKQKYSKLAQGLGPNRTKTFATQSQTYSNPNTTNLLRVNSTQLQNSASGPFQYNVPNPFDCSSNSIENGGNLVCGVYTDPCSKQILKIKNNSSQTCSPTYCSNVPGLPIFLCWNSKSSTYFPRQRRVMSNSLNKWPQGYKGFTSSISAAPPILSFTQNASSVILSWTNTNSQCVSIANYNIYENNKLINSVSSQITSSQINNLITGNAYTFYVTSVAAGSAVESNPSNILTITI